MVDLHNKDNGYMLILIAGIFWGSLGFFCNVLENFGFTPELTAFTRLFSGFIILISFSVSINYKFLIIDKIGLVFTALAGLISQTGFNLLYFNAIRIIGISSSAVLLYLSPLFLLIWSAVLFQESLTTRKIISLLICITGCFLAITGGHMEILSSSLLGIVLGILSALSYSLMSVFSKFLSSKYNSITIITYSFMFGSIFTLPFINLSELPIIFSSPSSLIISLSMGLLTSSIAYILYFKGIESGINLSNAGIISTVELIISIMFAYFLFGENFNLIKVLGIIFIIISIILINNSESQKKILPK